MPSPTNAPSTVSLLETTKELVSQFGRPTSDGPVLRVITDRFGEIALIGLDEEEFVIWSVHENTAYLRFFRDGEADSRSPRDLRQAAEVLNEVKDATERGNIWTENKSERQKQ